ncbi:MAG: Holliday junction resolvase RuvX [Gammaproteobacteria bacterium]|nr:Holliday junction resolvase RuvX [Gammaproteobacteria bacterium]NND39296.1 Holliday junction resolvase RuvX [Pseudomonadales bacterium]MBT8150015.1 Holliday junction resolvase RuvX [Gammaproteobacteria bacterium]NNL10388.1 Holliday junction resolvase RuvX [Pseudomonadales bacterium]NNM10371.1 Holliday junction resolvase RuvX [Pseudomonadales bacterium]
MTDSKDLLLGFDFGLRQIGVAVGEVSLATARGLCILKAKQGQPDWQQVEKLLKEWQPGCVVVGLPLNMDGSESESAVAARKFAGRLHGRFSVKVELQDERLSSREARDSVRSLAEQGERRVAHDAVDAEAAAHILQSYLNR